MATTELCPLGSGKDILYTAAKRLAVARMNSECNGSERLNSIGMGGDLAPDQNGVPLDVSLSRGKLNRSCLMRFENNSSNAFLHVCICTFPKSYVHQVTRILVAMYVRYLAQMTQCPYVVSLVSTPMAALTLDSVSIFMFCWAAKALSYASRDEADIYCFTSSGVC